MSDPIDSIRYWSEEKWIEKREAIQELLISGHTMIGAQAAMIRFLEEGLGLR